MNKVRLLAPYFKKYVGGKKGRLGFFSAETSNQCMEMREMQIQSG